jgi:catechol-2,3-dioxygenase
MINTIGVYHIGIPADDLERATRFYTEILGMKVASRNERGSLVRLKCGEADVVLFQRPQALQRNSLKEDGTTHDAFEVAPETFDGAIQFLKEKGYYHTGPIEHSSGLGLYFFDSEGNYQQLHTPSRD